MSNVSKFRFPVDIRFGAGSRTEISEFANAYSVKKPLLVTDSGLVKTEAFVLFQETLKKIYKDNLTA